MTQMQTVSSTTNLIKPAVPETKPEEPVKEFTFDVEEYLLNGYASKTIKKKLFSFKVRTLQNDESIMVYDKVAKLDLVTRAQADAVMESYYVAIAVMELNGVPLKTRKDFKDLNSFIDDRYESVKKWGGQITDAIYAEYNKLVAEVREALSEPSEIVKN